MILLHWFPIVDGFSVCPQWRIQPGFHTIDFTVTFPIGGHNHPLLLLEIKAPSHFHSDSKRINAIHQVIQRLDAVGPTNQQVDKLFAISALGRRWRACYALRGHNSVGGQPVKGIAERSSLRSSSPECWNPDIMSPASWRAFQKIANIIKAYVI